jgi:hypothetical protein
MVCRFILALFLAMVTRLLAMISSYGLALRFLTLVYCHDCSLSDPNRLLHLPASDLQHSASL